jgi:hypothetical protein
MNQTDQEKQTAIEHLSLIEASCKFHVGGVYPPLVIAGWKSTLAAGTPWQVDYIVADKPDDSFPITIGNDVPDYLSDLNAMHEAEKVLTLEQKSVYCLELNKLIYGMCATAAQRAEAFLKTLGLWEDGE